MVVFLFPHSSHGCYASVSMESAHSLYMQPAMQTGKQLQSLQRGSDWLFIRQELWHHPNRKFCPRGTLAQRKMKQRMKPMKYAWRIYPSQLLLLNAWLPVELGQSSFWGIMDGCVCCEVAQFNTSVIPYLAWAKQIRIWMLICILWRDQFCLCPLS